MSKKPKEAYYENVMGKGDRLTNIRLNSPAEIEDIQLKLMKERGSGSMTEMLIDLISKDKAGKIHEAVARGGMKLHKADTAAGNALAKGWLGNALFTTTDMVPTSSANIKGTGELVHNYAAQKVSRLTAPISKFRPFALPIMAGMGLSAMASNAEKAAAYDEYMEKGAAHTEDDYLRIREHQYSVYRMLNKKKRDLIAQASGQVTISDPMNIEAVRALRDSDAFRKLDKTTGNVYASYSRVDDKYTGLAMRPDSDARTSFALREGVPDSIKAARIRAAEEAAQMTPGSPYRMKNYDSMTQTFSPPPQAQAAPADFGKGDFNTGDFGKGGFNVGDVPETPVDQSRLRQAVNLAKKHKLALGLTAGGAGVGAVALAYGAHRKSTATQQEKAAAYDEYMEKVATLAVKDSKGRIQQSYNTDAYRMPSLREGATSEEEDEYYHQLLFGMSSKEFQGLSDEDAKAVAGRIRVGPPSLGKTALYDEYMEKLANKEHPDLIEESHTFTPQTLFGKPNKAGMAFQGPGIVGDGEVYIKPGAAMRVLDKAYKHRLPIAGGAGALGVTALGLKMFLDSDPSAGDVIAKAALYDAYMEKQAFKVNGYDSNSGTVQVTPSFDAGSHAIPVDPEHVPNEWFMQDGKMFGEIEFRKTPLAEKIYKAVGKIIKKAEESE